MKSVPEAKQLFVTDFDGTLLKDDKTISHEDFTTLEKLRQKKVVTAIATGRSLGSFIKALMAISMDSGDRLLPVDYVIFSTGAGIMQFPSCEVIWQRSVQPLDVKKITRYFDHQKFDYMVHQSIPDTIRFRYKFHGSHNPDFHARLALYREYAFPLAGTDFDFGAATEVLAIIPGQADMAAIELIKKDLSAFSVIHATSPLDHQSAWIEVFHRDVSKAKAVSRLVLKLGISRENVVSVGNDYNDQDLLAWSGIGFVVENAPGILKQQYKTVPSNNQSGMTRAARESGLV